MSIPSLQKVKYSIVVPRISLQWSVIIGDSMADGRSLDILQCGPLIRSTDVRSIRSLGQFVAGPKSNKHYLVITRPRFGNDFGNKYFIGKLWEISR